MTAHPGERYGSLTVLERVPSDGLAEARVRWRTRCDCGRVAVTWQRTLDHSADPSCGRHARAGAGRPALHGHAGPPPSPTYQSWSHMLDRCQNPANRGWHRYGGRGVRVCERWQQFAAFLEDMGERPAGMTLDRLDRDGDYRPDNCRWADKWEQARDARRQRADAAYRATAARELRALGWRLDEVGAVLGVTASTVRTWLADAD